MVVILFQIGRIIESVATNKSKNAVMKAVELRVDTANLITDNGIEVQYKLTKKNAEKDCGIIKVVGVNNHATDNLVVEGVTIAPGQTDVIAQCSMLDIIKLVNYMKTNNQGPWTQL